MKINEFLDAVSSVIACKEAKEPVRRELEDHLLSSVEEKVLSGMTEAAAEEESVSEMGDPYALGHRLDSLHRPRTDIVSLVLTILIILAGLYIQTIIPIYEGIETAFITAEKASVFYLTGAAVFIAAYKFKYSLLFSKRRYIYVLSLAAMTLLLLPHFLNEEAHLKMHGISALYIIFLLPAIIMTYAPRHTPVSLLKSQLYLLPVLAFTLMNHCFEHVMTCLAAAAVMFGYNVFFNMETAKKTKLKLLSVPVIAGVLSVFWFKLQYTFMIYYLSFWISDENSPNNFTFVLQTGRLFTALSEKYSDIIIVTFMLFAMLFIVSLLRISALKNSFGRFISLSSFTVILLRLTFSVIGDMEIFSFISVSYPLLYCEARGGYGFIGDMLLLALMFNASRSRDMFPEEIIGRSCI